MTVNLVTGLLVIRKDNKAGSSVHDLTHKKKTTTLFFFSPHRFFFAFVFLPVIDCGHHGDAPPFGNGRKIQKPAHAQGRQAPLIIISSKHGAENDSCHAGKMFLLFKVEMARDFRSSYFLFSRGNGVLEPAISFSIVRRGLSGSRLQLEHQHRRQISHRPPDHVVVLTFSDRPSVLLFCVRWRCVAENHISFISPIR